MASRFSLPHIDIAYLRSSHDYQGSGSGGSTRFRNRAGHGLRLSKELAAAFEITDALRPVDDRLAAPAGSYIEVRFSSSSKADTLDSKTEHIRSGAVSVAENMDRLVALYVPDTARPVLEGLLYKYLHGDLTRAGNPPNQAKVEAVEAFRSARFETFWTDAVGKLPTDRSEVLWWAVWCWRGCEDKLVEICERLNLRLSQPDRWMVFPETIVVPVLADQRSIELILFSSGIVAELRRANDSPTFFVDDAAGEHDLWADDLAERIVWPGSEAPAVCLLDTGVNRGHVLIEPALTGKDMHATDAAWGVDDHSGEGHGTAMAGIALHGDLTAPLADRSERRLRHRLESVKILPPRGFDPNEPHDYAPISQAAVALPEIAAPERPRVFCMAITNDNVSGARPSAWSAALDQAASGTMLGDDELSPKRLIVVSGGNIKPEIDYSRVRSQDEFPIEDPAQAWNILTVGGYTDLIDINEPEYIKWSALAAAGELSPHSRTSTTFPRNSPFKPEIVMEAGNRGVSPNLKEVLTFPSLSLCSTGSTPEESIVAFHATSAATAQAARLAAQISADHPGFWPETIRALIIHSADWTPPMWDALKSCTTKEARFELIRRFGYGVPSFESATASARNHLALFSQVPIQPYKLQGSRKFNECHYYDLPIPRDLLVELENTEVELKITLSYFVEPNPGMSASIDPQRYQSFGLRFDLRRRLEEIDVFKQRVNVSERDDPEVAPVIVADDERWMLGPKSVSSGSLHSDVWIGPAIELLDRDTLCIKPVGGWTRDRSTREVCNAMRRYALIISLKCRDADIDIYTPISTFIKNKIGTAVPISILG